MNLAYFAGFFDGEGCIVKDHNGTWPKLRISVAQIDPTPVLMFRERWGGYVHDRDNARWNPNARGSTEWVATAQRARTVLRDLLPHLIVKRAEAEAALAYADHVAAGTRGRPLREDEAAERQALLDRWMAVRDAARTHRR